MGVQAVNESRTGNIIRGFLWGFVLVYVILFILAACGVNWP